jgi:hypothetical protein
MRPANAAPTIEALLGMGEAAPGASLRRGEMYRRYRKFLRTAIALLAASLGCLLGPTQATALITIGSNLQQPPDVSLQGDLSPLTVTQTFLSAELVAPTPTRFFVNGKVVRWRIRTGDTDTGPVSFRIVRRVAGREPDATYTGVASLPPVTPPLNSVSTYDVNLPISQQELIGIDCCYPDFGQFFRDTPFPDAQVVGEVRLWGDPPLADGDPGRPWDADDNDLEMEVNADIEPTSTFPTPVVSSLGHGLVQVMVQAPNPGTLLAGDARDATIAATAKKKKKRRKKAPLLLRQASKTVDPGTASLTLMPTKLARTRLRAKKRLTGQLKVTFSPNGGSRSSQTLAVTLNR